jgi:hypothetical protein
MNGEEEYIEDDQPDLFDDTIDLADASAIDPEWIIKDLLPVGLTVIGAPPKTGKSLLAEAMLIGATGHITCNALPISFRNTIISGPGEIITTEATAGTLKKNIQTGLRVNKIDHGWVHICTKPHHLIMRCKKENPCAALLEHLERVKPRVVILDPFRDFHDGDENNSGDMVSVLLPLQEWANTPDENGHRKSVILVHHTTKPPAQERKGWEFSSFDLRGSGAIFGKADAVIVMTPSKGPGDITAPMKINAIFKQAEGWSAEVSLAVWDSPLTNGQIKLGDVDVILVNAFKSGMPAKDAAVSCGMEEKDVRFRWEILLKKGLL